MAKFFIFPFAQAGDKTAIDNDTQPSGEMSYESGFTADYQLDLLTDPDAKPIPRDKSNQLYFDITDAIRQYQTHGAPDWITSGEDDGNPFPYDLFSIVRYDDGTTGFRLYMSLVAANVSTPSTAGVVSVNWRVISDSSIPIGAMLDYAGGSLPANYLACDGTAVSRTTYAALFAAIGVLWGVGDGTTTFNLPNFARRTAVGSGGTGTGILGNAVGNIGGLEATTIDIVNMPAHDHPGSTVAAGVGVGTTGFGENLATGTHVVTVASQGGGTPINNMQPSAVVMKIIRFA